MFKARKTQYCLAITSSHVGDIDKREAVHVLGQGFNGKSLHLPLSFAVNLKLF